MPFYAPWMGEMDRLSREREEFESKKQSILSDIASLYISLTVDEKEGLNQLIKEAGQRVKLQRLKEAKNNLDDEIKDLESDVEKHIPRID